MTSREGSEPAPANPRPRSLAGSLTEAIKEQFHKIARAVTTIAMSPAQRRKRKEETKGAFKLARAIGLRVKRSLFDPSNFSNHVQTPIDEAAYFLRRLLDEWAQEDDQHQQHESFHYGSTADFDLHL